jgi:hypothetical protein
MSGRAHTEIVYRSKTKEAKDVDKFFEECGFHGYDGREAEKYYIRLKNHGIPMYVMGGTDANSIHVDDPKNFRGALRWYGLNGANLEKAMLYLQLTVDEGMNPHDAMSRIENVKQFILD